MQKYKIRPTAAIRLILRDNGFLACQMYTNKYKTCRTVKLYGEINKQIETHILGIMEILGVQGVTFKKLDSPAPLGGITRKVTIIRIPNQSSS